ncbi:MAG: hypothetical protein LBU43_10545 [Candidatus Accumulibacter sp.]|nr:hypothetical protein [Accumulibacter sp.]
METPNNRHFRQGKKCAEIQNRISVRAGMTGHRMNAFFSQSKGMAAGIPAFAVFFPPEE